MGRNGFSQSTVQVQGQVQQLSPQQVMTAKLTELPLEGLRDRINKELEANQWLEKRQGSGMVETPEPKADSSTMLSAEDSYDDADELPRANNGVREGFQREMGDTQQTFYDFLASQIGEFDVTDHEKEVLHYLIGSLEDDGFLRVSLSELVDELEIYQYVSTNEAELEHLLCDVVQRMDPCGVGARSLQECLLLQVRRNMRGLRRERLLLLLDRYWEDFSHMRWEKIALRMKLTRDELDELMHSVRRLTPRPGGSLESEPLAVHVTVRPDFLLSVEPSGRIRISLNESDLPDLVLSEDADMALNMPTLSKADQEAVRYLRGQISSAQLFLKALAQRRESMLKAMKAIVRLQREFFLTGDESCLRPMKLEDVAQLSGLDISTVSRVSNSKYVQTPHAMLPLRWFFTQSAIQHGQEVSVRNVLDTLKELIEQEDKRHPLSDEKLVTLLQERGFQVARRTVSKYRIQLGIPESRQR